MAKIEDIKSPSVQRQLWLHKAETALRQLFKSKGYDIPDTVRSSIGFPKGSRDGKMAIGQCWATDASTDQHSEIFISPELGHSGKTDVESSIRIMGVQAHEFAHAIAGVKAGHRIRSKPKDGAKGFEKSFAKWRMSFPAIAETVGLVAPWTATTESPDFVKWATEVVKEIGPFPAGALTSFNRPKDGCRQLKCECEHCGYIARTTKKWVEQSGPPICPTDKVSMKCDAVDGEDEGDDD